MAWLVGLGACFAQAEDCFGQAWKGTIGDVPVRIRFQADRPGEAPHGLSYYRASLVDLRLQPDEAVPGRWQESDMEGRATGSLTLRCEANAITGEWTSLDGRRVLPVAAQADAAYSRSRLDAVQPRVVQRGATGGRGHESFAVPALPGVRGLRLLTGGAGVAAINQTLWAHYLAALDDRMECDAFVRLQGAAGDSGIESHSDVVAWTKEFVVIDQRGSGYCGGAHPFDGHRAQVFDTRSGEAEDVSSWLTGAYRKSFAAPGTALGDTLLATYLRANPDKEEAGCQAALRFSGDAVWPTRKGLVFLPSAPHADRHCIQEVAVPHPVARTYLSPLGRMRIKSFAAGR